MMDIPEELENTALELTAKIWREASQRATEGHNALQSQISNMKMASKDADAEYNQAIETVESELEIERAEHSKLSHTVRQLEIETARLKAEADRVSKAESRAEKAEARAEKAEAKIEGLQKKADQLAADLSAAHAELATARAQNTQVK